MTTTDAARRPSPNQVAKREAIIAAAVDVLLRDGVQRCTVRAIAARAGVSKGAVHYYFADVDEIVDAAMLRAVGSWIDGARDVAPGDSAEVSAPQLRLWSGVEASLTPSARGERALVPLLLEYWAACTSARRAAAVRSVQDVFEAYVRELLTTVGVDDPAVRAGGVAAYLLGFAMQRPLASIGTDVARDDITAMCGLETTHVQSPHARP